MENVVAILFDVESEAYQAFSELKRDAVNGSYIISHMGLVRKQNNHPALLDTFDSGKDTTDDTAKGGLIGSLVGILGGPFGVILGGSLGALVGSVTDANDAKKNVSMLEQVGAKIYDGQTMIMALVQETYEEDLDRRVSKFKPTILRFDAAVIAEEVEEAEKLQKEMAKEAKRRMREEKSSERKQVIAEKRAKIKADFEAFKQKNAQK